LRRIDRTVYREIFQASFSERAEFVFVHQNCKPCHDLLYLPQSARCAGRIGETNMTSSNRTAAILTILSIVSWFGIILFSGSQAAAQGPDIQFKVGDHVEVDTLYSSTRPEDSKWWRAALVVQIVDPENPYGHYIVRLDKEGREMIFRFADPQWIRPASHSSLDRPEIQYKVGDKVEVDTLYTSTHPEESKWWRGGTVTGIVDPESPYGHYVVKLDMDGRETTYRWADPQWIRPAQAAAIQPAGKEPKPQAPDPNGQLKYRVGQRVEYIYDGKWYKAIIIKTRDDSADHLDGRIYAPYLVHPLGYNGNTDSWVCCTNDADPRTQLRPAGSGPTEPVPGGEANDEILRTMGHGPAATPGKPPAKEYQCVYFVTDQLIDAAPFTLTGNGSYTDSDGKRGSYTFGAGSTMTFHVGNYDGQKAEYDVHGGTPEIHILGPSGRRVIDCD
jgi:hypothetical protein